MARRAPGAPSRPSRGFRLSTEALDKLEREASALDLSPSQYLEHLILDRTLLETDYFAQQAAVSSFLSAALIASVAAKVLPVEEVVAIQERGVQLAAQLFGDPRRRPGEVGRPPEDGDPRVRALFEAFAPR